MEPLRLIAHLRWELIMCWSLCEALHIHYHLNLSAALWSQYYHYPPFYKWGNWGSERGTNLSRVIQPSSREAGIRTEATWLLSPCSWSPDLTASRGQQSDRQTFQHLGAVSRPRNGTYEWCQGHRVQHLRNIIALTMSKCLRNIRIVYDVALCSAKHLPSAHYIHARHRFNPRA